jgi:hypothetical protein
VEIPNLQHVTSIDLAHSGDCSLLGVGGDLTIFVEEVYGDEGWMAQRALRMDGTIVEAVDEDTGKAAAVKPLALPDHLSRPKTGWHTMGLNFSGARHRGIRSLEHVTEIAHPLSIEDRMMLSGHLDVASSLILGLAESYVLAEAELVAPHLFVVCRRLRVVYALEAEQTDEQNQAYDYDSHVLFAAHTYDRSQDVRPTLRESLAGLAGVELCRPMDCLIAHDHLFVADSGEKEQVSKVHVWRVERTDEKVSQ